MTRAEIRKFTQAFLQEAEGAPGLDPVLLDYLLDQACNEICRATGCYFLSYSADLVSGQSSYCAPPLYQIRSVVATLSDGSIWTLSPRTAKQLDRETLGWWRAQPNQPASNQGDPLIYIPDGLNAIRIYPVPNYSLGSGATATASVVGSGIDSIAVGSGGSGYLSAPSVVISDPTGSGASATATILGGAVTDIIVTAGGTNYTAPAIAFHTGGLTFEGYAVPKDGETSLWPADTDEPPIPARAHEAIAYRAASLRLLQKAASDPNMLVLRQQYEAEYARGKGYAESEAAKFTDATKYRACVGGGRHYGTGLGYRY